MRRKKKRVVRIVINDFVITDSEDQEPCLPITKKRKGRKLTEGHKDNIKCAKLGIKRSKETIDKISKGHIGLSGPNLGKKFSRETKDKMRLARLGKKMHSEETIDKLRQGSLGDKNPNWKGGRSKNKSGGERI